MRMDTLSDEMILGVNTLNHPKDNTVHNVENVLYELTLACMPGNIRLRFAPSVCGRIINLANFDDVFFLTETQPFLGKFKEGQNY